MAEPGDVNMDEFLEDMNTSVHIIQQGMKTIVLTKLDRDMLVDYLERLAQEIGSRLDTDDQSDMVQAKEIQQGADSVWAAQLVEDVF